MHIGTISLPKMALLGPVVCFRFISWRTVGRRPIRAYLYYVPWHYIFQQRSMDYRAMLHHTYMFVSPQSFDRYLSKYYIIRWWNYSVVVKSLRHSEQFTIPVFIATENRQHPISGLLFVLASAKFRQIDAEEDGYMNKILGWSRRQMSTFNLNKYTSTDVKLRLEENNLYIYATLRTCFQNQI